MVTYPRLIRWILSGVSGLSFLKKTTSGQRTELLQSRGTRYMRVSFMASFSKMTEIEEVRSKRYCRTRGSERGAGAGLAGRAGYRQPLSIRR